MRIYSQTFPEQEDEPFIAHAASIYGDLYLQRGFGPELFVLFFPNARSGRPLSEHGVIAVFPYEPDNSMIGFAEALAHAQRYLREQSQASAKPQGPLIRATPVGLFSLRPHGGFQVRVEVKYWGEYGCPEKGGFIVKPGHYPATGIYRGNSLEEVMVPTLGHWEEMVDFSWHTLKFPAWKAPAAIAQPQPYESHVGEVSAEKKGRAVA